jgi:hypothetical protein
VWDGPDGDVARLGEMMLARVEELGRNTAERIVKQVAPYAVLVDFETVRQSCRDHARFIFGPMARGPQDRPSLHSVGRRRAELGIPLVSVMEAYRIGVIYLWEELAAAALNTGVSVEAAMRASADMWHSLDIYTTEVTEGYREELTDQVRRDEQQRSSFVQALMEGHLGQTSLWEAAEVLGLARKGPFVVVLAFTPGVGKPALPRIEQDLRGLGIGSAWRLNHDQEVGVVCLPRPDVQLGRVVDLLTERSTGRVGVSPPYSDLRATTHAVRLARIALHGAFDAQPVVVFDRNPLAIAAASAPDDVMKRLSRTALAGLDDLAPAERAILLETLGAWFDSGGSVVKTAEALFVHRNTVRHRLRKLEERTGRSLNDPRWIAEVSLAFEIDRRLEPDPGERTQAQSAAKAKVGHFSVG